MIDNFLSVLSALPESEQTAIEIYRKKLGPVALAAYDTELKDRLAENEAAEGRAAEHQEVSDRLEAERLREKMNRIPMQDRLRTALHESAHALVSTILGVGYASVSIVPDDASWGRIRPTEGLYEQDLREHSAFAHLQVIMAGRAGSKLAGGADSGCGGDLLTATRLATKMIQKWGMSEKIGVVAFDEIDLLTRQDIQADIDAEVRFFISRAEKQAMDILTDNHDRWMALAADLVDNLELSKTEIETIIEGVEDGSQEM